MQLCNDNEVTKWLQNSESSRRRRWAWLAWLYTNFVVGQRSSWRRDLVWLSQAGDHLTGVQQATGYFLQWEHIQMAYIIEWSNAAQRFLILQHHLKSIHCTENEIRTFSLFLRGKCFWEHILEIINWIIWLIKSWNSFTGYILAYLLKKNCHFKFQFFFTAMSQILFYYFFSKVELIKLQIQ